MMADRTASSSGIAREDDHPGVRQLGADLAAGLDARAVGQAHVHDHDVGPEAARHLDRFGFGAGLGHDLELVAAIEERDEALPDHLVVVDHQDSQGGHCSVRHDRLALQPISSSGRSRPAVDAGPRR